MFALRIRLQETAWRRLDQDQYFNLTQETSSRPRRLSETSSRRFAKTSSRDLQDFFKTFWRRLQDVTRNFAEFSTKHLCRNLFLLSCEFCEIFCKNTFFPEQQRLTASDYSSINSSKGNIGKRNCKLWYKN